MTDLSFLRSMTLPILKTLLACALPLCIVQAAFAAVPAPALVVQTGHGGMVEAVAFAPDGKLFASAGADGIKLWHTESRRELRMLRAAGTGPIAFDRHGKLIASGHADSVVRLWDAQTGQLLRSFGAKDEGFNWGQAAKADTARHAGAVSAVAFSPDGTRLISASLDRTLRIWNAQSGAHLMQLNGHEGAVNAAAFSPNGALIASVADDKTLRLWSAADGRALHTVAAHAGAVNALAFAADGKTLATVGDDRAVKLWDAASARPLQSLTVAGGSLKCVALSSDGQMVATCDGADVTLWRTSDGQAAGTLPGRGISAMLNAIAWSPDGKQVLGAGRDPVPALWQVAERRALELRGWGNPVAAVEFGADGKTLFAGWGPEVRVWDLEAGRQSAVLGEATAKIFNGTRHVSLPRLGRVLAMASSPDGASLAFGGWDQKITLSDAGASAPRQVLSGHAGWVRALAFAPDGKTLASAGDDGRIKLWDAASGGEKQTIDPGMRAVRIAYSPNGKLLLATGEKSVRMFDAETGKEKWVQRSYTLTDLALFAPDGSRVAALRQHQLEWLDADTGRPLQGQPGDFDARSALLLANGRQLLLGYGDGRMVLWDADAGKVLREFAGHSHAVNTLAASGDGKLIASGSADNTTRLWRAADGSEVAALISLADERWVVTDRAARFDTPDLERIDGLHWVAPDDPFSPLPLEAFMRDYYEPRLLARALANEPFAPLPALSAVKRVQPHAAIVGITPDPADPLRVVVQVELKGAAKEYNQHGKPRRETTAAHDLRLFRNGQLVGYADGKLADYGKAPLRKSFPVRLAAGQTAQEVEFSAYAFNDDRVKSPTNRSLYRATSGPAPTRRAYLIHIGVNRHDNSAWNLQYAAEDAKIAAQLLGERLAATGQWQEVVALTLLSDGDARNAHKAAIRAVFERLAGKPAAPILAEIPGGARLAPATPDDLVLITFSGHGHAADDGRFYLLTQDTGPGNAQTVTEDLRRRSISSDELARWLRDIDAGDITFVVDACHSAASVANGEFKPGPMGSRGLGQLAFDKGMRILAASQADEYALEHAHLRQGLLSFALVTEGIADFHADRSPKDGSIVVDEWLNYAIERVPALANAITRGKPLPVAGTRGVTVAQKSGAAKRRPAQQPALFDFNKSRRAVVVARQ